MRLAGRRRTTWAAAVLAVGLVLPLAAVPVDAAPRKPAPTAAQVRHARAAARAAAQALAAATRAETAAQARLDALDAQLETAVEAWDAAQQAAAAAAATLTARQQDSFGAQAGAHAAQVAVDRLAAQSYQLGADMSGGLGQWAVMVDSAFSADGLSGLVERSADVDQLAHARGAVLAAAASSRLAAAQAEAAAAQAADDLAARQEAAAQAAAAVRAQEAAQRSEVARLTAVRDAAAATLRRARADAALLARQRAEALARAAAAARAARAARNGTSRDGRPGSDGGDVPAPQGQSVTTRAQRIAALDWARTQIGKPYVAGMAGPDSYDCSGLTQWAYLKVGHAMIHFSQSQYLAGEKIPYSQLQPGDLVFFGTDPHDWRTIHHVAIYAGHDTMVEAPHTGGHVQEVGIWWAQLMPFGARP